MIFPMLLLKGAFIVRFGFTHSARPYVLFFHAPLHAQMQSIIATVHIILGIRGNKELILSTKCIIYIVRELASVFTVFAFACGGG